MSKQCTDCDDVGYINALGASHYCHCNKGQQLREEYRRSLKVDEHCTNIECDNGYIDALGAEYCSCGKGIKLRQLYYDIFRDNAQTLSGKAFAHYNKIHRQRSLLRLTVSGVPSYDNLDFAKFDAGWYAAERYHNIPIKDNA